MTGTLVHRRSVAPGARATSSTEALHQDQKGYEWFFWQLQDPTNPVGNHKAGSPKTARGVVSS